MFPQSVENRIVPNIIEISIVSWLKNDMKKQHKQYETHTCNFFKFNTVADRSCRPVPRFNRLFTSTMQRRLRTATDKGAAMIFRKLFDRDEMFPWNRLLNIAWSMLYIFNHIYKYNMSILCDCLELASHSYMSPTRFFTLHACMFVFVVRLLLKWTPEVVYCIMDLLLGSVLDHATWNPLHTAHILCLEGKFERWKHGMGIYIVPMNQFLDRLFCNMSLRIIPGIKSETMWRWTSLRKGPW